MPPTRTLGGPVPRASDRRSSMVPHLRPPPETDLAPCRADRDKVVDAAAMFPPDVRFRIARLGTECQTPRKTDYFALDMPSPLGHTLAALAMRNLFVRELSTSEALLLSVLPDVDLIPTALGREELDVRHGHATHSLTAAIAAGVIAAVLSGRGRKKRHVFLDATLLYGSHILLDAFGKEATDGMPLLWPISRESWAFESNVFRTIRRVRGESFLTGLLNEGNAKALAREALILLPVLLASRAVARYRCVAIDEVAK